jgi:hypothetical protein
VCSGCDKPAKLECSQCSWVGLGALRLPAQCPVPALRQSGELECSQCSRVGAARPPVKEAPHERARWALPMLPRLRLGRAAPAGGAPALVRSCPLHATCSAPATHPLACPLHSLADPPLLLLPHHTPPPPLHPTPTPHSTPPPTPTPHPPTPHTPTPHSTPQATYCAKGCQVRHWDGHRSECRQLHRAAAEKARAAAAKAKAKAGASASNGGHRAEGGKPEREEPDEAAPVPKQVGSGEKGG